MIVKLLTVKLLTDLHLEFLSLKGGCRGSSESTHFKMPHCWKSHVAAQMSSFLSDVDLSEEVLCPDGSVNLRTITLTTSVLCR